MNDDMSPGIDELDPMRFLNAITRNVENVFVVCKVSGDAAHISSVVFVNMLADYSFDVNSNELNVLLGNRETIEGLILPFVLANMK